MTPPDADATFFEKTFEALTGHLPFPWQRRLFEQFVAGEIPPACDLPTGLGKTSVIPIWLLALAATKANGVPRRLVYVVNRRTVVDQATAEAENLRKWLLETCAGDGPLRVVYDALVGLCAVESDPPLAISTLRGQFADNREWSRDPARPAVIVGTVDMIGSRLLFSGYGCGFKTRPLHAGFLGQDALLVHDEAHLEPAFQKLIEAVEDEQNPRQDDGTRTARDFRPLRIMALTATPRGTADPFRLTDEDRRHPIVRQRLDATKRLDLSHKVTDLKKIVPEITRIAHERGQQNPGARILIFARTVDAVRDIEAGLWKRGASAKNVRTLTGTLRGKERDELVRTPVFQRFLPESRRDSPLELARDTVYLVCTSAGEVGIDISADHLVCDLSTLDAMAQRLGRVNRRGEGAAEVDVIFESDPDPKKESPVDRARRATLEILRSLPKDGSDGERHDGSPAALGRLIRELPPERRDAAFAPTSTLLDASDILFDAWALTSVNRPLVKEPLPGRPEVAEYLHGVEDETQYRTSVAWRKEVWELSEAGLTDDRRTELLDEYPLKPHELLSDATFRKKTGVLEQLTKLAARHPNYPVWVQEPRGGVTATTLEELAAPKTTLANRTVILPPEAGGLAVADGVSTGLLDGDVPYDGDHAEVYDVADTLKDGEDVPLRWHGLTAGISPPPAGMRRAVAAVPLRPETDDEPAGGGSDENTGAETATHFHFFVQKQVVDDDISKLARLPVRWKVHTDDVTRNVEKVVAAIDLPDHVRMALWLAAKFHDLGKCRERWQRSIGNPNPKDPKEWYAKSGGWWRPRDLTRYRHEFGSLLDIADESQEHSAEFAVQPEEVRELTLHLVAAHHGRGRPHFPADEAIDPDRTLSACAAAARGVPGRFARLQRRYGRWGLAYLESLLRAADIEASVRPSPEGELRESGESGDDLPQEDRS